MNGKEAGGSWRITLQCGGGGGGEVDVEREVQPACAAGGEGGGADSDAVGGQGQGQIVKLEADGLEGVGVADVEQQRYGGIFTACNGECRGLQN